MNNFNLKQCAHIGDAVWELFVREFVIVNLGAINQKQMHNLTTKFVNANFQAQLMRELEVLLDEDELEIARRARNLPLTINKKSNPQTHCLATSFEVLIGNFYLNDKARLDVFFQKACLILKENQ